MVGRKIRPWKQTAEQKVLGQYHNEVLRFRLDVFRALAVVKATDKFILGCNEFKPLGKQIKPSFKQHYKLKTITSLLPILSLE